MCYLQFKMVNLKNETIKQKVLVLNNDNPRHLREGMFPNESGKKNPEQICPRWSQKWAPWAFVAPLLTSKVCCVINRDAWFE